MKAIVLFTGLWLLPGCSRNHLVGSQDDTWDTADDQFDLSDDFSTMEDEQGDVRDDDGAAVDGEADAYSEPCEESGEPDDAFADFDEPETECETNSDCQEGMSCSGGHCVVGWTRTSIWWGGTEMDIDSRGWVYLAGSFNHEFDFDPGPGEDLLRPGGIKDGYLMRLNDSGEYLGTAVFGGSTEADELDISGLTVTSDDDVYVGGQFKGTVDLDPGPSLDEHQMPEDIPDLGLPRGIFAVRLAPDMSPGWTRTLLYSYENFECYSLVIAMNTNAPGDLFMTGFYSCLMWDAEPYVIICSPCTASFFTGITSEGSIAWLGGQYTSVDNEWCLPYNIVTVSSGDLFVNGSCAWGTGAYVDLDPGPGEDWRYVFDDFLTRLGADGTYRWSVVCDMPMGCRVLEAAASGGILLGGGFSGEADLDPGPGIDVHTAAGGGVDAYVSLFNEDLGHMWTWTSGYPEDDSLSSAVDDGAGRIYLAVQVGDGSSLIAMTDSGSILWTQSFPGVVRQIAAHPSYGLYLFGSFSEVGDFDPGPGEDLHTPIRVPDTFVTRLTEDGTY